MIPVSSAHLSDPVPVRQPAERSSTTAGVGIVLVSHSRALAEDALDLARRLIAAVDVPVELAAGLADGELGTTPAALSMPSSGSPTGARVSWSWRTWAAGS